MTARLTIFAALALAASTALPAFAQNIKPGLWEMNTKMQSDNGQVEMAMAMAQKHMANMSPEQRKTVDQMMAKNGISLSSGNGGGVVAKLCVTKEMVAQNMVPMQQHGDCTSTHSALVGNTMKVAFTCTRPPSSGEGQVVFAGDRAYTTTMNVTSSAGGRPETMHINATGTWLAADCGDIKPLAQPPAK